jgi:isocitrate dehydrogenase
LPDYPDNPTTDEERDVRARYDKVKGSAVNPVLREGNSDRRAPASVKQYARNHPHSMGAWSPDSKTNVAHMTADDFRSSETSAVMDRAGSLRISLVADDGTTTVLRESVPVLADEVVDATAMHVAALHEFLDAQIARAKADGVLFSVHLKATMMKVSDPIIFGHVVRASCPRCSSSTGERSPPPGSARPTDWAASSRVWTASSPARDQGRDRAGPGRRPGTGDGRLQPGDHQPARSQRRDRRRVDARDDPDIGPHVGSGREEQDTLAVIPDSSYAGIYQVVIDDCRANGAYDPTTMGTVPNVGLMAQAAEEYGSHDKTFEIPSAGTVQVTDDSGAVVLETPVAAGDIWRMCQTKDAPIQKLGPARGHPRPGDRFAGGVLARLGPRP